MDQRIVIRADVADGVTLQLQSPVLPLALGGVICRFRKCRDDLIALRIVFQPQWSKCRCVLMTMSMSSGATPAAASLSSSWAGCPCTSIMRSESLLPFPVSTSTLRSPVRMRSEFNPAVMKLRSSGTIRFDHMTFGTTPKKAPPSIG